MPQVRACSCGSASASARQWPTATAVRSGRRPPQTASACSVDASAPSGDRRHRHREGTGGTAVQAHGERLAQERQRGAVAPLHAGGLQAAAALALLVQLAQDPGALLAQGAVDLALADPTRRADGQAFFADDEADAATSRPAEGIGHALALGLALTLAGCTTGADYQRPPIASLIANLVSFAAMLAYLYRKRQVFDRFRPTGSTKSFVSNWHRNIVIVLV